MGSKENNELAWGDEKPQHDLELSYDYWAAKQFVQVDVWTHTEKLALYWL